MSQIEFIDIAQEKFFEFESHITVTFNYQHMRYLFKVEQVPGFEMAYQVTYSLNNRLHTVYVLTYAISNDFDQFSCILLGVENFALLDQSTIHFYTDFTQVSGFTY
jgi:hypothetical protein